MGDPRPEKVAIVEEVREKLESADGAMLTEYRGLDVPAMAELRTALREAGSEYKIYKNTLVRLAAREVGLEIDELLSGPTAIAFVGRKPDGSPGDVAATAKALKNFAKANEALIIKGGVLDNKLLSSEDLKALAELPPRDVLLAQLAGAFQAPMSKLAGLLQALPRDFAYGLKALIDQGGAAPAAEAAAEEAPAEEAVEDSTEESTEAPADEATEESAEDPAEASDDADSAADESSDESADSTSDETSDNTSDEASDDAPDQASADADEREA